MQSAVHLKLAYDQPEKTSSATPELKVSCTTALRTSHVLGEN